MIVNYLNNYILITNMKNRGKTESGGSVLSHEINGDVYVLSAASLLVVSSIVLLFRMRAEKRQY